MLYIDTDECCCEMDKKMDAQLNSFHGVSTTQGHLATPCCNVTEKCKNVNPVFFNELIIKINRKG